MSKKIIIIYCLLDIVCVGLGMGVPFFCILLGFPAGWYLAKKIPIPTDNFNVVLARILKCASYAAAFTLFMMVIVWGRSVLLLFDAGADFQNFGHPFILYDPKISFIGWLGLMIIISPFLQLLVTVFMAIVVLVRKKNIPVNISHE